MGKCSIVLTVDTTENAKHLYCFPRLSLSIPYILATMSGFNSPLPRIDSIKVATCFLWETQNRKMLYSIEVSFQN